jgi:hypothetical protein
MTSFFRRTVGLDFIDLAIHAGCLGNVVAECERDLWSTPDDQGSARHRRHRLEGGDDLVARCSGCEGVRYGMLERRRRRIDGDCCGHSHERRGPHV